MNTVTAQGAPNSLIRFFQENPAAAVELLHAARKAAPLLMLGAARSASEMCNAFNALNAAIRTCPNQEAVQ